jgi:5'-3' exonuclease
MGIKKGFLSFVKKRFPTVFQNVHISKFQGKRLTIDIFSFFYRYIHTFGKDDNRWIASMMKHFMTFKKFNVTVVPIFDGKPPAEKKEEREQRRERKEQSEHKLTELEEDLDEYNNSGKISELLNEVNTSLISKKMNKILMKNKLFNQKTTRIDVLEIQNYIENSRKKSGFLVKKDIDMIKNLFDLFGIPYMQAQEEAETLGCYLQNKNSSDCTISLDSDCIAYGIDYFIIDMNQSGSCTVFDVNELCALMKMTKEQIRDLCIICQCDYNSNGGGIEGVGPTKAIRLLDTFKNIEGILSNGYKDLSLNYVRCREIFSTQYPTEENVFSNLKWSTEIDVNKIQEFIKENDIPININDVIMLWEM